MTTWRPPLPLVAARLALLAPTVSVSYVPLGWTNAVIALGIGSLKAAIVAAVFMKLEHRESRTFIFAGAGVFWLGILLWLGLMDFLTRI